MYTYPTHSSDLLRARQDEDHKRAREHSLVRTSSPPGRVRRTAARTLVRAASRLDREAVRRVSA